MKKFFNFNTDCLDENELLCNANGHNFYWIERKGHKYNYLVYTIRAGDEKNNFRQFFVDKIYTRNVMHDLIPRIMKHDSLCEIRVLHELFDCWFDYMDGKVWTLHGGIDVSDEDEVYSFDPELIGEDDYYSDIIYP